MNVDYSLLSSMIKEIRPQKRFGFVKGIQAGALQLRGMSTHARVGDQVSIETRSAESILGEVIGLDSETVQVLTYAPSEGAAVGDAAELLPNRAIYPDVSWVGHIVDAFGQPLDNRPLSKGPLAVKLRAEPPQPARRKPLGERLSTGLATFDTMLPLVRGQRVGLFAGSGVGKSSLLGELARGVEADVVVYALIGERGRELRDFVDNVLGPEGMARSVLIAATSDQSPLIKRRAAWMAMSVAEVFRAQGSHVLLLMDSISRFAEAHREVALTAGEAPSLQAYPPSTANVIASLAERAGPGVEGEGDITAIFSVLVAGSDMDEPVADITRGVLDGHVILDREIAERGRFPAVDVRRSVSRSLPAAATVPENAMISEARRIISTYENNAPMIHAGLYQAGTDPGIDEAIKLWPKLDNFFTQKVHGGVRESFDLLNFALS